MIKTAIITPSEHINGIASQSNIHLLLAHQTLKDSKYVDAYKYLQERGDYIIMDNSAFELGHSMDQHSVLEAAMMVNADEIVAPEVFRDKEGTIKAVNDFRDFLVSRGVIDDYKLAAVVQGKTFEEFVQCYIEFLNDSNIDVIHVPMLDPEDSMYHYLQSKSLRVAFNRVELMNIVSKYYKDNWENSETWKPVHLLGLTDGLELELQKRHSFIRSNDSSTAFIHGFFGLMYTLKGLPIEKISTKMDFSWEISNKWQHKCINHNILMLKQFAGHYDN